MVSLGMGKGIRSQLPVRPFGCFAQLAPDPFTPDPNAGQPGQWSWS